MEPFRRQWVLRVINLCLSSSYFGLGHGHVERLLNVSAEDFHAAAVRTANKYRAIAAASGSILEKDNSEEAISDFASRLPTESDAGLWRVHVHVSRLPLAVSS